MFLSFSSFDGILNKNKSFDLLQNAVKGRINNRKGDGSKDLGKISMNL